MARGRDDKSVVEYLTHQPCWWIVIDV